MLKILSIFQIIECWFERNIHNISIIPNFICKWKGSRAFFKKRISLLKRKIQNYWIVLRTIESKNKRFLFSFKTIMPWWWTNNKNTNFTWKNICNQWKRTKYVFSKKTDVLLLTDIFQKIINSCKPALGVNSHSSFSTPTFTWKAGLKHTGIEFEYIAHD